MGTLNFCTEYGVLQGWIHHEVRTNIFLSSPVVLVPFTLLLHLVGYRFTAALASLVALHRDILVLQPTKVGVPPVFLGTTPLFYRVYRFLLVFS